jgi:hypothetical protein
MQRQRKQSDLLLQGWKERLQLRGEMFVVYVTCTLPFNHPLNMSDSNSVTGMPDKSALEEASRLFKQGGPRIEEL